MNFKVSDDLFFGVEEFNRFKLSIFEQGYKFVLQNITSKFGIIRNKVIDPNFNYFKVQSGNSVTSIKVNEGYAFDKEGSIIHQTSAADQIQVVKANVWQWVRIKFQKSTIENGVSSIGGLNKGLMTGVGTEFTKILRGQPNYPSKIRFVNSTRYNTLEYEVLEVLDDNNVILNGIFDVVETDLKFVVVGTFTPGSYPSAQDEEPFEYDDCLIELIDETIFNTPPVLNDGYEFYLARILYSTSNGMIVQDKRGDYLFQSVDSKSLNEVSQTNALIGIQAVKKFTNRSHDFFSVEFDFKLNIGSETRNSQNNLISISSGSGGVFKSTADFSDGDFDGWNYCYTDGTSTTIIKSIKNNNNIDLYVENIDEDKVGLFIAPNATEVEIRAEFKDATDAIVLFSKEWVFPITALNPKLLIEAPYIFASSGGQNVNILWKQRLFKNSTIEAALNSTTFYTEEAFNSTGALTDITKTLTQTNPKLGITL